MRPRSAIFALLALGIAVAIYLRPLTLLFAARDLYLYAIGMRGQFVEVGGHRIHYYVGGEGPPLVVVHGVASRAADGALIYRGLMRGRRVYALDLLGYGDSDKPRDASYSVRMQAEVVRGFMDALQLRSADMIGVSLGGWISLRFASEHPERVRRLVLVSSAGLGFPTTLTETAFSPQDLEALRRSLALQTDRAARTPPSFSKTFCGARRPMRGWCAAR